MLSPDHYYPDDDVDLDYGLDLDQFDYGPPPQPRNRDDFDHVPYDHYDDRHEYYNRGYHSPEPPYLSEYNDNIVMKTRPEFNEIPGRPFEPREYYEDRYANEGRRAIQYPRQPQPHYPHEPRVQDPRYSRSNRHHTYDSRDQHDAHRSRGHSDFYHSARYRKPSSDYMEEDHRSARSSKTTPWGNPRAASPKRSSGDRRHKNNSNMKEKIRNFPAPNPKLPAIPPPDYDGADVGVKYVPKPDY